MCLNLTAPAAIAVFPEDSSVYVGDTTILSCVAYGLPLPTITWLKEEQPLVNVTVSEGELVTPHVTFARSTLQLCAVQLPDHTHYTCQATSNFSAANATFSVSVKGKLNIPNTYSI